MKKNILLFSSSLLLVSQLGFGLPVDDRQENQQTRVANGVVSGELTKNEAKRLTRQQTHIAVKEAQFKSDGTYTARERASIQHRQNNASRNIFVQKHDAQDRN